MTAWKWIAHGDNATHRLGSALAEAVFPGAVVSLVGDLGAGKTRLVRAFSAALGVSEEEVGSPTFVLIREYPGRLPVYHFDTYRLKNSEEFQDLGVDEYFHGEGVCFVEWGDRVKDLLPGDHLRIEITILSAESREFTFTATGPRSQTMLNELKERMK